MFKIPKNQTKNKNIRVYTSSLCLPYIYMHFFIFFGLDHELDKRITESFRVDHDLEQYQSAMEHPKKRKLPLPKLNII